MRRESGAYGYEVDAGAVRRRMDELGMTPSDVCRAMGLDPTALSHIINGKTLNPSASRMMLLCDALDVDPIDLMRRVDIEND